LGEQGHRVGFLSRGGGDGPHTKKPRFSRGFAFQSTYADQRETTTVVPTETRW